MAFRCGSCSYTSDRKTHLLRHISRNKSTCAEVSPESLDQMAKQVEFPCRHANCHMRYTAPTNRRRHEKKCPYRPVNDTASDKTTNINQTTVSTLKGNHNNVANAINNNTNNVNVTIHINSFDDFKPSEISKNQFLEYMASGATNVILKCLEAEQFNLSKPENMNVFISNLKDKIARVYDGCRWRIRNGDDVVDHVTDTYVDMVNESIDEFEQDSTQSLANKIQRWRKNIEKEEFERHVKQQVLHQLYDLRGMVKDTHNVKQR